MQAYNLQQKGKAVLVDVREAKYYEREHAAECVNVGLFRAVEGRSPLENLKRLAMAGFAMEATGAFHKPLLAISHRHMVRNLLPVTHNKLAVWACESFTDVGSIARAICP